MELLVIAGFLALAAFFGNIRLVALCALLAIGFGWYYEQMPKEQRQQINAMYCDARDRCDRAWKAFWL
ncbi:MAG: hypothetical protein QG604_477 [Candidatus Dependentiae bacterium]|nr:hypothetical protein [Candidatus Dependentiae bacterium]